MPKKGEPEMKNRAPRVFVYALPDHPSKTEVAKHVGGLLGISLQTLRTWARREEINAGLSPRVTTVTELAIRQLKRENAELRKANAILKAKDTLVDRLGSTNRCNARLWPLMPSSCIRRSPLLLDMISSYRRSSAVIFLEENRCIAQDRIRLA